MSDLRDELAEVIWTAYEGRYPGFRLTEAGRASARAYANAILPIIERETKRARAEVGSLIRAHQNAEAAYWAMAEDVDAETATRLAADVTRTYEGES